ncbi:MAG: tetratricopeptide repeat protein [Acidobacteria bacterium]|nr:tetratricopeptide repeat protein [Acidobacteriota bacterium]
MRTMVIALVILAIFSSSGVALPQTPAPKPAVNEVSKASAESAAAEFDRLRTEGNDAVYNLDYKTAREKFDRLVKLAPDHPAGFIYLANNLWLEWLNSSRRLSASLYNGEAFYQQDAEEDKFDPKRDKEFNDFLRQAISVAKARLQKNPQDTEALYYQGAALGLRAAYSVTVKRSFRRAMGDANGSIQLQKKVVKIDPNYCDAYLSLGLYQYVIDSLPFVWRTLARLAGLKGSKKEGIANLELATQKGRFAADDARVILIGLYSREQQPEKALEVISYLATKYPRNYLLGVERANMLYQRGRHDEGAASFAALLKDAPIAQVAADHINFQWGEALMKAGDFAAAIEHYQAVTRWPKADKALVSLSHLHAGQALDALGKREAALAEYQTVLQRENIFDAHKQAAQYIKKPYADDKIKGKG